MHHQYQRAFLCRAFGRYQQAFEDLPIVLIVNGLAAHGSLDGCMHGDSGE